MTHRPALLTLFLCLSMGACGDTGPSLPAPAEPLAVELWPESEGAASSYSRLAASYDGDRPVMYLFEGDLSTYHERRVRSGDLPGTLERRRIPLLSHDDVAGSSVWVPGYLLAPGRYSVATERHGVVRTFDVVASHVALAERIWPPSGALTASPFAVYCAEEAFTDRGDSVTFEPGHRLAQVTDLVDATNGSCALFELTGPLSDGDRLVPPQHMGEWVMDPQPITFQATDVEQARECAPPEVAFGPGCATVLDDRIIIRPPVSPVLWWARAAPSSGAAALVESTSDGSPIVLRGLLPDSSVQVSLRAISASGEQSHGDLKVHTAEARAHVVIDEVLANPLGPEPDQEWVEILNDGTDAVELAGWTLADSAGRVPLPGYRLEPGARALIVADDFQLPNAPDVPVPDDVPLLVVPTLGGNGLSNGGETLSIVDAEGRVISVFPALDAKTAGVSIQRLESWAPADDLGAFAPHPAPGASPGESPFR